MPVHFLVSINDDFSRLEWTFLTFQVENVAKSLFTTDFLSSNKRIFASEHRLVRQLVRKAGSNSQNLQSRCEGKKTIA